MKLFAFMGASGGGKSTIQHSLPLRFLTHYVTREIRDGEVDGYHVKHISRKEFQEKFENGDIATRTEYSGNLYGAPTPDFFRIAEGIPYHATATIDNAQQFRRLLGDKNVVVFYIKPPSVEVLRERMEARGDAAEDIEKRIAHIYSANELANESYADYVIINDDLQTAIAQVYTIIQVELGIADLEQFRQKKEK